jgi:hypothetical protein
VHIAQLHAQAAADTAQLQTRIGELTDSLAVARREKTEASSEVERALEKQWADAIQLSVTAQHTVHVEKTTLSERVAALQSELTAQTTEVYNLQMALARATSKHTADMEALQAKLAAELSSASRDSARLIAEQVDTITRLQSELAVVAAQAHATAPEDSSQPAASVTAHQADLLALQLQLDAQTTAHASAVQVLQDELKACQTDLLASKREVGALRSTRHVTAVSGNRSTMAPTARPGVIQTQTALTEEANTAVSTPALAVGLAGLNFSDALTQIVQLRFDEEYCTL